MNRLVTIPISHYCEKARWALDRVGLPYVEEPHLQMFHYVATLRAGGGVTAPVLAYPGGVLPDSNAIMRWADAQRPQASPLYPADRLAEVERWVQRFDDELGVPGRLLMYQQTLSQPDEMLRWIAHGVPGYQTAVLRSGFAFAKRYVEARLGVSDEAAAEALTGCERLFDEVAARRQDRPFLVGDGFTAADLTFAALASPLLCPPLYGVPLPEPEQLPESYAAIVTRFREHPTGVWGLALYDTHRRERGQAL